LSGVVTEKSKKISRKVINNFFWQTPLFWVGVRIENNKANKLIYIYRIFIKKVKSLKLIDFSLDNLAFSCILVIIAI